MYDLETPQGHQIDKLIKCHMQCTHDIMYIFIYEGVRRPMSLKTGIKLMPFNTYHVTCEIIYIIFILCKYEHYIFDCRVTGYILKIKTAIPD